MQLHRCTSIFILFLCSLVASCGKSETAVAPSEGAAGQVRELQGTVTATRAGQKPRTLAESDTIFVNDSLHTADDASVVILFAHNNARWQLGSGYQGKVIDSLAWRTKRHEASALVRTEHTQTAAAGRDSEREAAESVETLEIAPAMDMVAPDLSVPHKGDSDKDTRHRKPKPTTTSPQKPKSKPAPPRPPRSPPPPAPETALLGESAPGGNDDEAFMGGIDIGSSAGGDTGVRGFGIQGGGQLGTAARDSEENSTETSRKVSVREKRSKGNSPESKKRNRRAPSTSKRSPLISGIGKTCSAHYKQKGSITVSLTVTNSRISRLVVTGDSSLAKTKRCIEQKLRRTQHQGDFSDKVTITLQ